MNWKMAYTERRGPFRNKFAKNVLSEILKSLFVNRCSLIKKSVISDLRSIKIGFESND